MRRYLRLLPLAFLSVCAQGCSIAKALYVAIVHNSGAPPRAELARLDERQHELMRTLSTRRVLVLPVAVLGLPVRHDTATSASIARQLRARVAPGAVASELPIVPAFEPQPNEAAIFWQRFKGLAAAVAAQPRTDVDYILLIDVMGAPERGSVGAVHVMGVTAKGEMALRRFWNSHQPLYKEMPPHSFDDVARMVVTALTRGADSASNTSHAMSSPRR